MRKSQALSKVAGHKMGNSVTKKQKGQADLSEFIPEVQVDYNSPDDSVAVSSEHSSHDFEDSEPLRKNLSCLKLSRYHYIVRVPGLTNPILRLGILFPKM
jgi:hypothetical protein